MDKSGLRNKYRVARLDGKPVQSPCLVLELAKDPQAKELALAIAAVYEETRPQLAADLRDLAKALEDGS